MISRDEQEKYPAPAAPENPWAEMAAIIGGEHIRDAAASDVVAGVAPSKVIEPGSAQEFAKVLVVADRCGLAVVPRGGGTKSDWGNPPRRADAVLSTRRLIRILEHAWGDLTLSVEAGCTVAQVQAALAKHRQRLAIDPLWPERATIGGILAANDSGILRTRFGSLRDLIIGITIALPSGVLARSGGKVVKNVAGYDLPKLNTGALGTLGVITQAVFRLHGLPRESRSVSFASDSLGKICARMNALRDSNLSYTALQVRANGEGNYRLDLLWEGTPEGIAAQDRELRSITADLQSADPSGCWSTRQSLWEERGRPRAVVKISVLPMDLANFCAAVESCKAAQSIWWELIFQSLGVGLLRIEGDESQLVDTLTRLRPHAEKSSGSLVVLSAPLGIKRRIDSWGDPGDALPLMRAVKQQLDPHGILNPGRFVGGI
ncbi:MAG: FAD-binding oxidoreductase [Candidatus Acidiferrales bacterium]